MRGNSIRVVRYKFVDDLEEHVLPSSGLKFGPSKQQERYTAEDGTLLLISNLFSTSV
jgi:hypothetical protein